MNSLSFQNTFQEDFYPSSKPNFIQNDSNIDLFFGDGYESSGSPIFSNSSLSYDSYGSECLEAKRRPTQIMKGSMKKTTTLSTGVHSIEEENDYTPSNHASESPEPTPAGWSEEKDQILLKLGAQYKGEWKKLSKRFSEKQITPRFLKNRYNELTFAPIQRRVKFSPEEDLMLVKYFEKYGANWKQIASHFVNRTPVMLKNRYYSFIKKKDMLNTLSQQIKTIETNDTNAHVLQRESSIETRSSNNFNYFSQQQMFPTYNSIPKCAGTCNGTRPDESQEIALLKQQVQMLTSLLFQTRNELIELKTQIVQPQ